MPDEIKRLYRYTTLAVLIDLLENSKLVLLDPSLSWEDKNDTLIIEAYKEKAKIESLFALCFTHRSETIHHWKTFAGGSGGCCIQFNADKLFEVLDKIPEIRHGVVEYHKINEAHPAEMDLKKIPFTKRIPYQFEREYRIIWEGKCISKTFSVEIDLGMIQKITFSQQMPEAVFDSVKSFLQRSFPELKRRINRSTIYENKVWINKFKGGASI